MLVQYELRTELSAVICCPSLLLSVVSKAKGRRVWVFDLTLKDLMEKPRTCASTAPPGLT